MATKTNFQAFKLYTKIGLFTGLGYYAYLEYKCTQLAKEYSDFDLIQSKKDTTRPSNVYYGINWGYRSDETMEKSMDTGDLLFFNYNCDNCFSARDTIYCKAQQAWKRRRAQKANPG